MRATNSVERLPTGEDQNFTFVSLTTAEKQFPAFVQTPTIDHQLGQSVAALLSFEPEPDEPTAADVCDLSFAFR
jgi:hypothetical protein